MMKNASSNVALGFKSWHLSYQMLGPALTLNETMAPL